MTDIILGFQRVSGDVQDSILSKKGPAAQDYSAQADRDAQQASMEAARWARHQRECATSSALDFGALPGSPKMLPWPSRRSGLRERAETPGLVGGARAFEGSLESSPYHNRATGHFPDAQAQKLRAAAGKIMIEAPRHASLGLATSLSFESSNVSISSR